MGVEGHQGDCQQGGRLSLSVPEEEQQVREEELVGYQEVGDIADECPK